MNMVGTSWNETDMLRVGASPGRPSGVSTGLHELTFVERLLSVLAHWCRSHGAITALCPSGGRMRSGDWPLLC